MVVAPPDGKVTAVVYGTSEGDSAESEAESISALKGRVASFASYVSEKEKESILIRIAEEGCRSLTYSSELLSTDELLKLGFAVINEVSGVLLIMMQPAAKTCLLLSSGDFKCGKFVKENVQSFGGRGGGRDDNARAVFTDIRDMKAFATAAEEVVK